MTTDAAVASSAATDHPPMQPVANPLALGFASVGKLTGAAANMFQDMLGKFYSESLDELDYDFESKEADDILYGASKHILVSVLADVAVGVLVPDQPFPPDTLLHHYVFVDMMNNRVTYALQEEIEHEQYDVDISTGSKDTASGRDSSFVTDLAHANVLVADGKARRREERKQKREDKATTRLLGLKAKTDAELLREVNQAKTLSSHAIKQTEANKIRSMLSAFETRLSNSYDPGCGLSRDEWMLHASEWMCHRRQPMDVESLRWDLQVRARFHNWVVQTRHPLANMMLPPVDSQDVSAFTMCYRTAIAPNLIKLPEKENTIIFFNSEEASRTGVLARRVFLRKSIAVANNKYEATYEPVQMSRALRMIAALSQRLPFLCEKPSKSVTNTVERVTQICEQLTAEKQLITNAAVAQQNNGEGGGGGENEGEGEDDGEDEGEDEDKDDGEGEDEGEGDGDSESDEEIQYEDELQAIEDEVQRCKFRIEELKKMVWSDEYHRLVAGRYDDLNALHAAVCTCMGPTFDSENDGMTRQFHMHPTTWRKQRQKHISYYVCGGCEAKTQNKSEFRRCSRCNMEYYCSKQCQVAAWKGKGKGLVSHKVVCNEYLKMVSGRTD